MTVRPAVEFSACPLGALTQDHSLCSALQMSHDPSARCSIVDRNRSVADGWQISNNELSNMEVAVSSVAVEA
jgi:hypothetical protein